MGLQQLLIYAAEPFDKAPGDIKFLCSIAQDYWRKADVVSPGNEELAAWYPNWLTKCQELSARNFSLPISDMMVGWDGVTFFPSTKAAFVKEISFAGKPLGVLQQDFIPPALGSLSGLQSLDLSGCRLKGPIPNEIYQLTSLQSLVLSANQLRGFVSKAIGDITGLQRLMLNHNRFANTLPNELFQLAELRELYLMRNQFQGTIPAAVGNLQNLVEFHFYSNRFTGTIPDSIYSIPTLRSFSHCNNFDPDTEEMLLRVDVPRGIDESLEESNIQFCNPDFEILL